MDLIKPETASHWYYPDGTPCHHVSRADGRGMRNTTLRDARKLSLRPSVTNILGVIAKPGLEAWKQEQIIYSALTLPRKDGESDHDFAKRVVVDAKEQSIRAADDGRKVHSAISDYIEYVYFNNEEIYTEIDNKFIPYINALLEWIEEYEVQIIDSETSFVHEDYAGTRDLKINEKHGLLTIVDIKTQEFEDKPNIYPEWSYQLVAYAEAAETCFIGNLVLSRNHPGKWYYHQWEIGEFNNGLAIFHAAKDIWQRQREYWPEENNGNRS